MRFYRALANDAAVRYRPAGRFAYHFARGKLTRDAAFAHILEHGLLARSGRILDLGCGQGLLAALLEAARAHRDAWPSDWPLPPDPAAYLGIDVHRRDIDRARQSVDGIARFACADIRSTTFEPADTIVLLDVLHYFDFDAQNEVLSRARAALDGDGMLLLRVADESSTSRHRFTIAVDRIVMALRRHRVGRLYARPLTAWIRALEALDFEVTATPMPSGLPFANVLLVARYDSDRRK
jgi:SAM-dependent methyltransferase